MSFLVFHESIHLLVAALISLGILIKFKNPKLIALVFLMTIFIDIDHLIDYGFYALTNHSFNFVFATDYFHQSGLVIVPFHGWEWAILIWWFGKKLAQKYQLKGAEWALTLAFLGHLVVDQLSYSPQLFAYFFTARSINGFNLLWFNGL